MFSLENGENKPRIKKSAQSVVRKNFYQSIQFFPVHQCKEEIEERTQSVRSVNMQDEKVKDKHINLQVNLRSRPWENLVNAVERQIKDWYLIIVTQH